MSRDHGAGENRNGPFQFILVLLELPLARFLRRPELVPGRINGRHFPVVSFGILCKLGSGVQRKRDALRKWQVKRLPSLHV